MLVYYEQVEGYICKVVNIMEKSEGAVKDQHTPKIYMVYRARVYRHRRSRSSPACIRRAASRTLHRCSCSWQPARA
jgi:2-methylaconitate cis-trans-isomerase PrpF